MQSIPDLKIGTLVAFRAKVSKGSFPNERYVSIPIEGKQVTGFLSDKFIEDDNKAVGVVAESPSKDSVSVFFSGELSNSGNIVAVSLKWLLENAVVIKRK
jgi:hypothetical protein